MKFRPNTNDAVIWNTIEQEYDVPALRPDDVVIDVGANIGAFADLAWRRGSRRIYAFEADRTNFELAGANLLETTQLNGVHIGNYAIVRSDSRWSDALFFDGYPQDGEVANTGGGHVFGDDGTCVRNKPLDSVLETMSHVRLLKIDAEYSEWPILFTAKRLDRVAEVIGEYHMPPEAMELAWGLDRPCTPATLEGFLVDQGFSDVRVGAPASYQRPGWGPIGSFSASR